MAHEFVGHINVHWLPAGFGGVSYGDAIDEVFKKRLACQDAFVVMEYGTENGHCHFHYWAKTSKAKGTVINAIKAVFQSPGVDPPAQWFSCKVANAQKMSAYLRYCAKGPHAEHGVDPCVLLDLSGSRMWPELHEAFHKQAAEIAAARGNKETWYEVLARQVKEKCGDVTPTKKDVTEVVCRYYIHESKKGFDKFAVTRTVWAVYALVNAADAESELLEQVTRMID